MVTAMVLVFQATTPKNRQLYTIGMSVRCMKLIDVANIKRMKTRDSLLAQRIGKLAPITNHMDGIHLFVARMPRSPRRAFIPLQQPPFCLSEHDHKPNAQAVERGRSRE